jgi:uncharacterized protein YwgA
VNLVNWYRLASFIKALDNEGILKFDKKYFNHRLRLQKYVFIARNFGFNSPYDYSLYIRGPYSSSLADDYYEIKSFDEESPINLDKRFVRLVKGKSDGWLELAATIIMIRGRYKGIDRNKLISLVKTAKPYADRSYLVEIMNHLEKYACLS